MENELKKAKYNYILNSSKVYVLKEGLSGLTIAGLARELNIGEATIYRYFGTRTKLIVKIGVSLWQDTYTILKNNKKCSNAFEDIESFFNIFYKLFVDNKNNYKVIDEFDQMLSKKTISKDLLVEYNDTILKVKRIFDEFYKQGIEDGSVRSDIDPDAFYYSATHMLLGLCKKLATQYQLILCDDCIEETLQIKTGIQMVLKYIKNEEK